MKTKPGRKADPHSKRSQGVDRHKLPRRAFHADPRLFLALAVCVRQSSPPSNESAVLREALTEYLTRRGFLKDGAP